MLQTKWHRSRDLKFEGLTNRSIRAKLGDLESWGNALSVSGSSSRYDFQSLAIASVWIAIRSTGVF
ncbi:MAG: hypothetical protein CMI15_15215 [Opitutaceae bacterium]|nr:hypothetical protein [Opitutaceae bacterium]